MFVSMRVLYLLAEMYYIRGVVFGYSFRTSMCIYTYLYVYIKNANTTYFERVDAATMDELIGSQGDEVPFEECLLAG